MLNCGKNLGKLCMSPDILLWNTEFRNDILINLKEKFKRRLHLQCAMGLLLRTHNLTRREAHLSHWPRRLWMLKTLLPLSSRQILCIEVMEIFVMLSKGSWTLCARVVFLAGSP